MKETAIKHLCDYLEPEQVHAMLDAARTCSRETISSSGPCGRTGTRASELLALTPSDIKKRMIFSADFEYDLSISG
jgi:integrase